MRNLFSRLTYENVRVMMWIIALCAIGLVLFVLVNIWQDRESIEKWNEQVLYENIEKSEAHVIADTMYKDGILTWINDDRSFDKREFKKIRDELQYKNDELIKIGRYIFIDSIETTKAVVASKREYIGKTHKELFVDPEIFRVANSLTSSEEGKPMFFKYSSKINDNNEMYVLARIVQKNGLLIGAAVKIKSPSNIPFRKNAIIFSILGVTLLGLYILNDNYKVKEAIHEVPVGVILLDVNGRVEDINKEARESYPHLSVGKSVTNGKYKQLSEYFVGCIKGEKVEPYYSTVEKDGKILEKETKLHLIQTLKGKYVVVFDTDVTERKEQERQIQEQNDYRRFINLLLGHTRKNMLYPYIQGAEMHIAMNFTKLEDYEKLKAEYKKIVAQFRFGYHNMDAMNMLNKNWDSDRNISCINIKKSLGKIKKTYKYIFELKNVAFDSDNIDDSSSINMSSVYFEHIFRNLIDNALQSMSNKEQSGTLTVESVAHEDHVEISVSDTGQGIETDLVDKLYSRDNLGNYRVGLGSVLCTRMINSIGGKIWIAKTDSNGTTISFTIPKCN